MRIIAHLLVICCVVLAANGRSHFRLAQLAQNAGPSEFPHQVSIQACGKHFCGGSLISKTHVLTAGHCVSDMFEKEQVQKMTAAGLITVQVGSTTIGGGQKHKIKRVWLMSGFDKSVSSPYFITNDLAIITLATPVKESANVKIISLPAQSSELSVGTKVTVSGFGSAVVNGPTSSTLGKSDVYLVSQQECNQYYTTYLQKQILSQHLCAKSQPGVGTCQGDSGGPLIHNNVLVGLVSGGDGQCGAGNPDVYTKVSQFVSLIKAEMKNGVSKPNVPAAGGQALNLKDVQVQPNELSCDRAPQALPGSMLLPGGQYPGYPWVMVQPQVPVDPNQGLVPVYPQDPNQGLIPMYPQDPNQGMVPGYPVAPQQPQVLTYPVQPGQNQIVYLPIPGYLPVLGYPQLPTYPVQLQPQQVVPGYPSYPGQLIYQ